MYPVDKQTYMQERKEADPKWVTKTHFMASGTLPAGRGGGTTRVCKLFATIEGKYWAGIIYQPIDTIDHEKFVALAVNSLRTVAHVEFNDDMRQQVAA